jgi:hypothetical protein
MRARSALPDLRIHISEALYQSQIQIVESSIGMQFS